MPSKSALSKTYVGPRALFDPYYLPPELVGLKKEQKSMQSILADAFQDHYPIILSLYGLRGIGKTTLTRKTLSALKTSTSKNNQQMVMHYVNCEEKNSDQIIFALVNELSQSLSYNLDPNTILDANLANLINLFTHLVSKSKNFILGKKSIHQDNQEHFLMFFLDSIEYMEPNLFNKINDVCKTQSCYLITSFNLLKSSPYLSDFKKPDLQIQLHTYSPRNLEKISLERCNAAFKHPIDRIMVRYVTDLVNEFDYCVPESCLRVLRDLYPIIEGNSHVNPEEIQNACRYQFKRFSIDEISIADFISETDIVDRLALDELNSFFQTQTRFYVTHRELINMYRVACESMEYEFQEMNFNRFLRGLLRIVLLQPSNFKCRTNSQIKTSFSTMEKLYFLTISPQILNEILDVAFGLVAFD